VISLHETRLSARAKTANGTSPLIIRVSAEYCERSTPSGKICRSTASALKWTEERKDDQIFRVYRRKYKRRFAWSKAGRVNPEAFYTWSEKAREKKAECEEGKITLKEYQKWLKDS